MARQLPLALASGYALAGSLPPLIAKLLPPTDVPMLLIIRFATQACILFLFIVILRLQKALPSKYTLLAGLYFAAYSLAFFESLELTQISHAIILSSLYPLELMVYSLLMKQHRFRWTDAAALACVTAGLFMLWDGGRLRPGDLLASGSSLAFSAYILANNKVVFRHSVSNAVAHQAYVSAVCAAAVALVAPIVLRSSSSFDSAITGSWLPAVCIAAVGALSHTLLMLSQRSLTPLITSIVAVSSPVLAALIGTLVFNSGQALPAAIGCGMCAIGLFVVSYSQHRLPANDGETVAEAPH